MRKFFQHCTVVLSIGFFACSTQAGPRIDRDFPSIAYVQYESYDLLAPDQKLTVSGQLRVPPGNKKAMPAVVILHGSAGLDSRGVLYSEALNDAGIATLEIDMWAARDIEGGGSRPPLPTFTLPDAFGALEYLANTPGIDAQRIGVLGFSWGGVMSLLSADQTYTSDLGNGNKFATHVAHYPVCWGYTAGIPGISFDNLTGAPVLIQVGSRDDYDEGGEPCENLAAPYPEVSVKVYRNAEHAWDRLQPAITVEDPFSHLGAGGEVNISPKPGAARKSQKAVVKHFEDAFGMF